MDDLTQVTYSQGSRLIPVSIPTVALSSSQAEFQRIVKRSLIDASGQVSNKSKQITRLNAEYDVVVRRANQTFDEIISEGRLTPKGKADLAAATNALKTLEHKLHKLHLSDTQRKQANRQLQETERILENASKPERMAPLQRLTVVHDILSDVCYAPPERGVLPDAKRVERLLDALVQVAKSDRLNSLQTFLDWDLDSIAYTIEDWAARVNQAVKSEFRDLVTQYPRPDAVRQLIALDNQLQKLQQQLQKLVKELPTDLPSQVQRHITQIGARLQKLDKDIATQRKTQISTPSEGLPALAYGSKEWKRLVAERPVENPGYIQRAVSALTPANWTKETKATLFGLLQLSHQVQSTYQQIQQASAIPKGSPTASQPSTPTEPPSQEAMVSSAARTESFLTPVFAGLSALWRGVSSYIAKPEPEQVVHDTLVTLNEMRQKLEKTAKEIPPSAPKELLQLRQAAQKLIQELRLTRLNTESPTCPADELMVLVDTAAGQCFRVEELERQIAEKMEKARPYLASSTTEEALQDFGNKHANLELQYQIAEAVNIPGFSVPRPHGLSNTQVTAFLNEQAPDVGQAWNRLNRLYQADPRKDFLKANAESKRLLEQIDQEITKAFETADTEKLLTSEMRDWLTALQKQGHYLMVRSTGAEDSRKLANAGGNVSKAYVTPTPKVFLQAVGEVVRSYFGEGSLQNRLNPGENPFAEAPKMAVTAQQLIGEPVLDSIEQGAGVLPSKIPASLVLFSNEPLWVGDEEFRVMRVSASWGHGEAVVGNQGILTDTVTVLRSVRSPNELYVLYANRQKNERMAPVRQQDGSVKLEKVRNPPDLVNQPALNEQQIESWYTWAATMEAYFGTGPSEGLDFEGVCLGTQSFGVQVRPVNRDMAFIPTYLDTAKLKLLPQNPIIESQKATLVVPGKSSVIVLTDPSQVLVRDTLEKAEKDYDANKIKLVVVKMPEPDNSHPVVNFSGLGVPCLEIDPTTDTEKLLSQSTISRPMAVDMQVGTLNVWNEQVAELSHFVTTGYAVHPAKVPISLKMRQEIRLGTGTPPTIAQELKDAAAAIQAYRQDPLKRVEVLLDQLRTQQALLQGQLDRLKVKPDVSAYMQVLKQLETGLQRAYDESKALSGLQQPGRLKQLLHAKVLANLVAPTQSKTGQIASYTLHDVEPIADAVEKIISYQKQLEHPAHLADLVLDGDVSLTPAGTKAWTSFLLDLEPWIENGRTDPTVRQQVAEFRSLLTLMRETDAFSTWFTFFFHSSGNAVANLKSILATIGTDDKNLMNEMSQHLKTAKTIENQLDRFSDPKQARQALEELWNFVRPLVGQYPESAALLQKATPLAELVTLKTLHATLDVFDHAIKTVKASSSFTPNEKMILLGNMLPTYFSLSYWWMRNLADPEAIPIHPSWPITQYMDRMARLWEQLSTSTDTRQLLPSSDFSRSGAMLGSRTAFERHQPETWEDFFTLTHGNAEVALVSRQKKLSEKQIEPPNLPAFLKESMGAVESTTFLEARPQRLGIELTKEGATVRYSIPLRNHAGLLELHYDKASQTTVMTGQFLGEARKRWTAIGGVAQLLSEYGLLPLVGPVRQTQLEVRFSWKLADPTALQAGLVEYHDMCQMTMDNSPNPGNSVMRVIDSLISKTDDVEQKKIVSLLQQLDLTFITGFIQKYPVNGPQLLWSALEDAIEKGRPNIVERLVTFLIGTDAKQVIILAEELLKRGNVGAAEVLSALYKSPSLSSDVVQSIIVNALDSMEPHNAAAALMAATRVGEFLSRHRPDTHPSYPWLDSTKISAYLKFITDSINYRELSYQKAVLQFFVRIAQLQGHLEQVPDKNVLDALELLVQGYANDAQSLFVQLQPALIQLLSNQRGVATAIEITNRVLEQPLTFTFETLRLLDSLLYNLSRFGVVDELTVRPLLNLLIKANASGVPRAMNHVASIVKKTTVGDQLVLQITLDSLKNADDISFDALEIFNTLIRRGVGKREVLNHVRSFRTTSHGTPWHHQRYWQNTLRTIIEVSEPTENGIYTGIEQLLENTFKGNVNILQSNFLSQVIGTLLSKGFGVNLVLNQARLWISDRKPEASALLNLLAQYPQAWEQQHEQVMADVEKLITENWSKGSNLDSFYLSLLQTRPQDRVSVLKIAQNRLTNGHAAVFDLLEHLSADSNLRKETKAMWLQCLSHPNRDIRLGALNSPYLIHDPDFQDEIFKLALSDVDPDIRRKAKESAFAILTRVGLLSDAEEDFLMKATDSISELEPFLSQLLTQERGVGVVINIATRMLEQPLSPTERSEMSTLLEQLCSLNYQNERQARPLLALLKKASSQSIPRVLRYATRIAYGVHSEDGLVLDIALDRIEDEVVPDTAMSEGSAVGILMMLVYRGVGEREILDRINSLKTTSEGIQWYQKTQIQDILARLILHSDPNRNNILPRAEEILKKWFADDRELVGLPEAPHYGQPDIDTANTASSSIASLYRTRPTEAMGGNFIDTLLDRGLGANILIDKVKYLLSESQDNKRQERAKELLILLANYPGAWENQYEQVLSDLEKLIKEPQLWAPEADLFHFTLMSKSPRSAAQLLKLAQEQIQKGDEQVFRSLALLGEHAQFRSQAKALWLDVLSHTNQDFKHKVAISGFSNQELEMEVCRAAITNPDPIIMKWAAVGIINTMSRNPSIEDFKAAEAVLKDDPDYYQPTLRFWRSRLGL